MSSPQQRSLLTHHIAARLWVLSFAFLLALLPVAVSFDSANNLSDTGLVTHLDAQTALHDNGLRLSLKKDQAGQASADNDPPEWQTLIPVWLLSVHITTSQWSLNRLFSAKASLSRFVRPYLRAPPLS